MKNENGDLPRGRVQLNSLELLMQAANEDTWKLVRDYIGQEQLALMIAKGLISLTTGKLKTSAVASAFGTEDRAAQVRIENAALIKEVND